MPIEDWRAHALTHVCVCADQRKPCEYHDGYADGLVEADAELAGLRVQVKDLRQTLESAFGLVSGLDSPLDVTEEP